MLDVRRAFPTLGNDRRHRAGGLPLGGVAYRVEPVERLVQDDNVPVLRDRECREDRNALAHAPLFGRRLDAELIKSHWDEIGPIITAMRNRTVVPSLILKKLSAYRQQNGVAAALREIGRVERTLFTLRWFKDAALRRLVTAELDKGEARNSLARAVAFHRLGRFRDRGHENQQTRAAALNLVTAAIVLFNCRYLGRALGEMRARGLTWMTRWFPSFRRSGGIISI